MNKIILTLTAVMILSFAACAQNKGEKSMLTENKPLVVYFSATGTTAKAARTIAEVTGGTLYEIVPQQELSRNKFTLQMTLIGTTESRVVRWK